MITCSNVSIVRIRILFLNEDKSTLRIFVPGETQVLTKFPSFYQGTKKF
jgi:hypothetical protein